MKAEFVKARPIEARPIEARPIGIATRSIEAIMGGRIFSVSAIVVAIES